MRRIGLCIRVWRKAGCLHQLDVDPQTLIDLGHGNRPLTDLRYRCKNCGSKRTDWVVAAKRTAPWPGDRQ
jgi:hypothetical protein